MTIMPKKRPRDGSSERRTQMPDDRDAHLILAPHSIRCVDRVTSKKRALDLLSQVLAEAVQGSSAAEILDGLAGRERLGSTALGDSVAMPHMRIGGIEHFIGAFMRLAKPVNFDASDGHPVQLLFGLLIPENASEKQLKEVRVLVRKLRDPALQRALGAATDPRDLYDILAETLNSVEHA
jgi:PTS system nitrogen regulatory IIA component